MKRKERRLVWLGQLNLRNPFIDENYIVMRSAIKWFHKRHLFDHGDNTFAAFEDFYGNVKVH